MNFAALRAEVRARGVADEVTDARINTWINVSINEICEEADWPFLLATATGPAPLTIADVRTIESVTDTTLQRKLLPLDRRSVSDDFPDLTSTGSPAGYFFTSQTTIDVFPANTSSTLQVRYWKAQVDLSGDSDTPVIPTRYHYAIVDLAYARARADKADTEGAATARAEADRLLVPMRQNLLGGQDDRPLLLDVGGGDDW